MNKRNKIIIIYLITLITLLFFTISLNDKSLVVIFLNKIGIDQLHSKGNFGFYYPSIIKISFIFLLKLIMKKINYSEKLYKGYLYHCFGIILLLNLIQEIGNLDIWNFLAALIIISYLIKKAVIIVKENF